MNNHVTKLFLEWHEKSISDKDHALIEEHLYQCGDCRKYFEKMSGIFDDPALLRFDELAADQFLPARIKAQADAGKTSPAFVVRHWFARWSFAAAGTALAIIIGILLGKGLSEKTQISESTDIASEYFQAFSQHGFSDQWESTFNNSQGESK